MANSLQKQLMKAGLADEKKARKAKQQKREDVNKAKRGEIEMEDPADRARRLREEKAEADRQREAQRKAEREKKEIAAQIKQMIEQSRLERNGEVAFQFVQDKKIKKAYVTGNQQKQLERGQIAIVALGESFELVPTVVAEKIRQRDEAAVLLLNERGTETVDEDDPYKDFPIPDDLMW
ncbi:MAG: nucleoprotein/polynucleotide-associated enzyme [Alcanivorax borkumensis]|jgi:uncharacterized protein YaiL (DUF2058 family)|uniref:Nucleoprotein/polynucleotide-associated enzyme n=2 Tax=Alcanivorax TaxID=59753 RepID=Q0VLL1_ALCBS|nr:MULTISPECIES: DUF2058 domain-containing protein [Alcanivorax]OJH07611.1 MAG: nucleoprotein/polynucleotide-associated enzyme [Alcanivorax borkumensis]EUC71027.1 nucleoprotein/polynucleotide-associated enzyme [Alcanivorax sp. 97CO-5]PKG02553.1 DUF2058 domain-containing protein [Alcanivorax sp. 97CO-6]CAL17937.1 hypothetical protein predicted by Glimmer/Critica [Alcanivorax borkumensis SK2]BAP15388.1 nucleoprotein/polynucleotide-associated enzyme [Alcanivorax sp. NBRC 101098]